MIVFGVFLYNKKSVLYALVVHVEYCVLFYLFYSSCLLRQPRKGNIQEDAPSFLNVVLLGHLRHLPSAGTGKLCPRHRVKKE
jgi:hypothetical protein